MMTTKTILLPLRGRSDDGDLICNNGELDSFSGVIPLVYGKENNGIFPDGNPENPEPYTLKRPSMPAIEFSLLRTVLPGWNTHPESLPTITATTSDRSERGRLKAAAETLEEMLAAVAGENLFAEPFLVLAAFRTSGGFHISPTPPVLMIPNSAPPIVETVTDSATDDIRMSVTAAVCRLQYRLSPIDDIEEWSDRLTHLDIFVSSPLPLYDRSLPFRPVRRTVFQGFTHSMSPSGAAGEIRVWENSVAAGFAPTPISQTGMTCALAAVDKFHLISAIPLQHLTPSEGFTDIPFNCGGTPLASPYPTYRPDYAHLSAVKAAGSVKFSGRTTLFDLTLTPPDPLPLKYAAPFCNQAGYVPRFLFHPDKVATSYNFSIDGTGHSLPLRPHPTLHGAFAIRPLSGEATGYLSPAPYIPAPRHYPDALWRSTKSENLLFPDNLLLHTDTSKVIAIVRAFRSSGLVATTSPTAYLFTSEGVFLIREMDDGTLRDAGLITRHCVRDLDSVFVGANGVTFITPEDEAIRIEGTKAEELSPRHGEKITLASQGGSIAIVTRPLKLSEPGKHVRLLSISFGGTYDSSSATITLEGSLNLRQWHHIATAQGAEISGIWPPCYPFFRLTLSGSIPKGHTICAIKAKTTQGSI